MSIPSVLVAAPGTVTSSIRDVLRDWVALGLVAPFLWVDADEVPEAAALADIVATHVLGATAPRVRLQDYLADQRSTEALRLVLVGALGGAGSSVKPDLVRGIEEPLRTLLPGRLIALQVFVVQHGAGGWRADLSIPGWQTLVLAPEDSWNPSPQQAATEITVGGDPTERTAHAAAGLAAVAGLWTGIGAGPFDIDSRSSDPVAVRAFLRRLDASQATAALRTSLMDVSAGLPRPETSQGRCEDVQDPVGAGRTTVDALITRHASLFALDLKSVGRQASTAIGGLAAIKLFLAFLFGSIRRAPGNLFESAVAASSRAVSARVQQALFGGNSQYEVVTRGITASGLPPGAEQLGAAADSVRERLAAVLPTERATPDVSALWSSVISAGLTLADGGERLSGLDPTRIGGKVAVVRDTALVAPSPDRTFLLPPPVVARVEVASVSPYDVRQQSAIAAVMAGAPATDPEVQRTAADFDAWRQQVTGSYTGLLGSRLADDVAQRAAQLKHLLSQLATTATLQPSVDTSAVADEQALVRRAAWRFLFGLLAIASLTAVLFRYTVLGAARGWTLVAVLLVGWAVVHVLAVIKRQQRVFALLNARRQEQDELEVASHNLPKVANGLYLSSLLYEQYLLWAPVLGRFLQQPFGPPVTPTHAPSLTGSLPRAVGFGVVHPDAEQVAVVAYDVGGSVFEPGWLSPLWQSLFDDAGRRLGSAGLPLRDAPLTLWADTARSHDSLLRRWSSSVAADGITRGAGDALWERARAALLARGTAHLTAQLLTSVEVQAQQAHGITERISGQDFFTALTDTLESDEQHYFSPALFTAQATAQEWHHVDRTVVLGRADLTGFGARTASSRLTWIDPAQDAADTLDQFLVVVQASIPMPGSSMTLRGNSRSDGFDLGQPPQVTGTDDTHLSG